MLVTDQKQPRILQQALNGERIVANDPQLALISEIVSLNDKLLAEFNSANDRTTAKSLLNQITGKIVPVSSTIKAPFQTDFGRHIFVGENVFINRDCMFADLGGIYIEDDVLIGPRVTLVSVNHVEDPKQRRDLLPKAVLIKSNAWIGAGATILPGVTVGKNAIVGAGSVITKNVPDNAVVAGVPAKYIRDIHID